MGTARRWAVAGLTAFVLSVCLGGEPDPARVESGDASVEGGDVVRIEAGEPGRVHWLPEETFDGSGVDVPYWISFAGPENAGPEQLPNSPSARSLMEVVDSSARCLSLAVTLPGMGLVPAMMDDGHPYSSIRVPGAGEFAIGKPDIPIFGQWILVPNGTQVSLTVDPGEPLVFGNADIPPVQPPRSGLADRPAFTKDDGTYLTNGDYPGFFAEVEPVTQMRGQPCTILWVYPYQYNPVQGTLSVWPDLVVHVDFIGEIQPLPGRLKSAVFDKRMRRLAVNAEHVLASQEAVAGAAKRAAGHDGVTVAQAAAASTADRYLIICHEDFKGAAHDLAAWKRLKGLRTEVVTTGQTGTTTAEIKSYLEKLEHPPTYLLLLGDAEYIPCFYEIEHAGDTTRADGMKQGKVASDRYYADLGDDGAGDLYIGRLPVDTAAEAQTAVKRIVEYERTPPDPSTDAAYYTSSAHVAYFQDDPADPNDPNVPPDGHEDRRFTKTSEDIYRYLTNKEGYACQRVYYAEPNVTPIYWNKDYPDFIFENDKDGGRPIPSDLRKPTFAWNASTTDIVSAVNSGVSILTFRGHGSRGIRYEETYFPGGWGHPELSDDKVAGLLSNGQRVPVVWSVTCQTGWFDNETDEDEHDYHQDDETLKVTTGADDESLCEALILDDDGGAVGVIGSTRNTFSGTTDRLMWGWTDAIWPAFIEYQTGGRYRETDPVYEMGCVLEHGKRYMQAKYNQPDDVNYVKTTIDEFHWFGDPSMEIWTGVPEQMTVETAPGFLRCGRPMDVKVTVKKAGVALEGARVTIAVADDPNDYDDYWTGETDESGTMTFAGLTASDPGDYNLVITAHNCLPVERVLSFAGDAPAVTAFAINNGASSTSTRTVTLNNARTGSPSQYMASESSGFSGATWKPYSTAPSFTLGAANGTKRVYFKVRDSWGQVSPVVSDTITLTELKVTSFKIDNGASSTRTRVVTLNNVCTGSPSQYMASESSSFGAATWKTYSTAPSLTLSAGNATKRVYFKVRDASGQVSPVVSDTITLNELKVTSFKINNGASSTGSRTVTLNNVCTGSPSYYMAGESSSFSGATWKTYSTAPSFTLSADDGTKAVYFKVKDSAGRESAVVNDTITLTSIVTLMLNRPMVQGEISPAGDEDWYQFTLSDTEEVMIQTESGTLQSSYLDLYGPDSRTRLVETDWDDNSSRIIHTTLWPGVYYIKVTTWVAGRTGTYVIGVWTSDDVPSLTIDGYGQDGEITPAGDMDWYKFTVPSSGMYKIDVLDQGAADPFLYVYGPDDWTDLLEKDFGPITMDLSPGTYYVKVQAYSAWTEGAYRISVTAEPVIGLWDLLFQWEGSLGKWSTITFHEDGSFTTGAGETGSWYRMGDSVWWVYSNWTTYDGTLSSQTQMSGTMTTTTGSSGTWSAVKRE